MEIFDYESGVLDLLKPSQGGGGGGTDDYTDLTNKPKINSNTLSGNKTSSQLGLQDELVSGTNIKTINSTSLLGSGDITATEDVQINGTSIVSSGVANIPIATSDNLGVVIAKNGLQITAQGNLNINKASEAQIDAKTNNYNPIVPYNLNYAVRSVAPACTIITGTTATITANSTYASTVNSSGLVATLVTPSDLTVYSGFIFQLDTTNSASVAFQTDDTTPVNVVISGSPTLATGKKYTVTGQYSILNNAWELWIIEYKGA